MEFSKFFKSLEFLISLSQVKNFDQQLETKNINKVTTSKGVTCSPHTDTHTHRQTDRVTTGCTLSGFQNFFLQPIIKDPPKNKHPRELPTYVDYHSMRLSGTIGRKPFANKYRIKQFMKYCHKIVLLYHPNTWFYLYYF